MEHTHASSWKSWKLWSAIVIIYFAGHLSLASKIRCREREKILATMDLVENCIAKAKTAESTNNCTDLIDSSSNNRSQCSSKVASKVFMDVAMTLMGDLRGYYEGCIRSKKRTRQPDDAADCSDLLEKGNKNSGVYRIWPRGSDKSVQVYCDMHTDGGGWTVIQRRGSFPVQEDFYRVWKAYAAGFGNASREYWIGNDNLHILTKQEDYTLRFDMEDKDGKKAFAIYKFFQVGDSGSNYKLNISGYTGDAGDCMVFHNGAMFSTKDEHHDVGHTCAISSKGGWWYNNCYSANPNGLRKPGSKGMSVMRWNIFRPTEGIASIGMMLRKNSWTDDVDSS